MDVVCSRSELARRAAASYSVVAMKNFLTTRLFVPSPDGLIEQELDQPVIVHVIGYSGGRWSPTEPGVFETLFAAKVFGDGSEERDVWVKGPTFDAYGNQQPAEHLIAA